MKKGKLFVIDGTDGSGKQTQFAKLEERLTKDGIDYRTFIQRLRLPQNRKTLTWDFP